MAISSQYKVSADFGQKLCCWIETQEVGICYPGSGWNHGFDLLAGSGAKQSAATIDDAFKLLESNSWVFCHLNYDVKNELEDLKSENADRIGFPEMFFFEPELLFQLKDNQLTIFSQADSIAEQIVRDIEALELTSAPRFGEPHHHISHERYLSDLTLLQNHMQLGDIYQANYCHEFYWENASLSTASLFNAGFAAMPNPFSVYYKLNQHHCISFSPERFLQIRDRNIISQPMKGTAARGNSDEEDKMHLDELRHSEKDRRENVMIVDLVRNDLSHFAQKGSVKVPELYQVETYPKVHQMYSTVTAKLVDGIHPLQAILKAFPMGSMTGAPKIRAMQLLEKYEHSKRGLFSGTIGYFAPDGRADFSVVIRSFLFNSTNKVLSCHAGGGITILSDPQKEYEETFIKAQPLFDLLN